MTLPTRQVPTATATPRTLLQRLLDELVTRTMRLPAPTTDYTMTRDLPIPTCDGVELLADMYTPTVAPVGTILVRSPYGFPAPMAAMTGTMFANRGYRILLARCRGTFGSGGAFEPMIHEVDDAADTVAWMREQPWFDGRFATYGGSYLGFTQWALLVDPPPELVTAVISIGPHDFRAAAYQGGAFNLNDFLGWSNQVARQEDFGFVRGMLGQVRAQRRVARDAGAPAGRRRRAPDGGTCAVVSRLGERSRPRRSVLEGRDARSRAGSSVGSGAAPDRMAGPLPYADTRAVRPPVGSQSRRRPDRWAMDTPRVRDQGWPHRACGRRWTGWPNTWVERASGRVPRPSRCS